MKNPGSISQTHAARRYQNGNHFHRGGPTLLQRDRSILNLRMRLDGDFASRVRCALDQDDKSKRARKSRKSKKKSNRIAGGPPPIIRCASASFALVNRPPFGLVDPDAESASQTVFDKRETSFDTSGTGLDESDCVGVDVDLHDHVKNG